MKTVKLLLIVLALLIANIAISQNCSVNAGIDQTVCTSSVTLTGAYATPVTTTWSQVSGPTAAITNPAALATSVTGLVGGNTYRFRISTICGDGLPTYDEVTVTAQNFPIANAGNPITICTGNTVGPLSASALQSGETGAWTIVSGSGGLTVNNPTSPTSTLRLVTGTSNSGSAVLRWTVTNTASGCSAYSDVTITKIAVNTTVSAGNDITISNCYNGSTSTSLSASYSGGGTYGRWTVVTGPNTPTITNVNAYNTSLSNLIEGVYILRWTVTTACIATTSDDVRITVNASTGSVSTASATIVGNPTMPFCDPPASISLAGSTYNEATEYVTWTKASGVGTIASPNSRYTTVSGFNNSTTTVFRYTITNSTTGCYSSANVTISFEAVQTITINTANPYSLACNATSATISVSHTGSTTPQWIVASYPTGYSPASWTNISGSSFTINNLTIPGTYIVRIKKTVGTCSTIYKDINVIVSKSPTASNAGSDPVLACNATSATIIGNTPASGTGKWSQISGPNTATIVNSTNPQTNITGLISGLYEFRWTISNGITCPITQDEVRVKIASSNPTTSNAGIDQTICNTSPLILDGNLPTTNEIGTWTVSPTTGVVFSNRNSAKAVVTGLAANTTYTFTWTIVNNCASSTDNVVITTNAILGPIASLAGDDQCLASGTAVVTLAGNSPVAGTGTWTKITGSDVTITNSNLYNTTVTGLSTGTYTFEWAIARNACTITRDTVTVTISAAVTTANAGSDQLSVCGTSTTLIANTPSVGNGIWTQVSGNGGVLISNPTNPTTSISNMTEGQYTFRWTISNDACSSSTDDVVVYASTPPTTPLAGTDKTVCGLATATMTANTIASGTGYWNVVSGPNAPTITNNASPTTTVTGLITGEYIFTWNSRNGLCTPQSDEVIVTVIPAASAGGTQTICGTTFTTLTGNANTTGTWTQVSPSQTVEVITPILSNAANVTNLIQGTTYVFKYTLTAADACATSKEATVTVNVLATPTAAVAGTDYDICITNPTTTLTLIGNSPTSGTGVWSRTTGTGTITSSTSSTTTVTNVSPGINTFVWTISNGACTSIDQIVIRVSRVVQKSAGNDQTVCGTTATLAAEAPTSGVGTWSQISGPNAATFASTITNSTSVSNLIQGTYEFKWTVSDGDCEITSDNMTLVVNGAPTTPNAGENQELCNTSTITLDGNIISNGAGNWSQISGAACTITSVSNPRTTITGATPGTYEFRWTASNGSCSDLTDDVTILINEAPSTADAGTDIRICLYDDFSLNATSPTIGTGVWSQISGPTINFTLATYRKTTITGAVAGNYTFRWTVSNGNCTPSYDDVSVIIDASVTEPNAGEDQSITGTTTTLAGNTISSGTGVWSKVSGPIGAIITNPNSPTTTITGIDQGTYILRWTATNGNCTSYDDMSIIKSDLQTYNIAPEPTFTTCNISWMNGSRASRVVFMKEGTGTIINPVNKRTYTASTNWAEKGSVLGGSGFSCIYNGTGSSVKVTGLYPGRTYTIQAFEYNGSNGNEDYLTSLTGIVNPTTYVPWPTTTFSNSPGITAEEDWNTSARWDHDTIPSTSTLHEAVLVYIDGNCKVTNNETSYNLTIKAVHDAVIPKLTISAGSSLNITGGALGGQFINSGTVDALIVKASATQPNGTLTWKKGNPSGTVEMYSKASWDLTKPVNNKYKWQFMGIPVIFTNYSNTFSNCYLREWDESITLYDDVWARRNNGTSLQKGPGQTLYNNKGYELVQQVPRFYTFKGLLQHDNFVQTLSYTPTAYFKGQHIFGNPYTAAIDIRTIVFGENTENTVYQYNCGTYTDWIDNDGENTGIDGTELTPARYAVATKQTAGVLGILRQIPSMQGFLVKATNVAGGSITIPYPTVMKNSIHQRAKQDINADIVATRIDVKGTYFSDKMWIFVDPSCTSGFDNGWDGIKLPGDEAVTQIYGIENDGAEYQINAVNDINESVVGFKPGNDKDFTIKFTHENIQMLYSKLYLVDMVENKTIDVTTNGSQYIFSSKSGDPIKRFKITTGTTGNDRVNTDNNLDVFVRQNVICINNRNASNAEIALYDEIGRCITNNIATANSQSELPVTLAKGVYILKISIDSNHFSKRIILN